MPDRRSGFAPGMEARRVETALAGSVHDSPATGAAGRAHWINGNIECSYGKRILRYVGVVLSRLANIPIDRGSTWMPLKMQYMCSWMTVNSETAKGTFTVQISKEPPEREWFRRPAATRCRKSN